jgi:FMN phosphatase YigB (HAD superfamily)
MWQRRKPEFRAKRSLYVGDSFSSDIVGGNNAGWKTAWFTALIDKEESLETEIRMFRQTLSLIDFEELLNYLDL